MTTCSSVGCRFAAVGWDGASAGWDSYATATCWVHTDKPGREASVRRLESAKTPIQDAQLQAFDFTGEALKGVRFLGGDLSSAQFRNALLDDVQFSGTTLDSADFHGAHLIQLVFAGVTAVSADFSRAKLTGCRIESGGDGVPCNLRQASFRNATVNSSSFAAGTDLAESTFEAAFLHDVTFHECQANNSDFKNLRADKVAFDGGSFSRSFFVDSVFALDRPVTLFDRTNLEGSDFRRISVAFLASVNDGTPSNAAAFRDCVMSNCDFDSAQLDHCRFVGGRAESCSFNDASLSFAGFESIELVACSFSNAYLRETVFAGSTGSPLNIRLARFSNAVLVGATLRDVVGKAAQFDGTLLDACRLSACEFQNAVFDLAIVKDCRLDGRVDFTDASLAGTSFERCQMDQAVFVDARLTECTFTSLVRTDNRLDFSGADLSGSDLSNAPLQNCDFVRATMDKTTLAGACLSGAKCDESRLSDCDLSRVQVDAAFFRGARLRDCSLLGATFTETSFALADLTGTLSVPASMSGKDAEEAGLVRLSADGTHYVWEPGQRTVFRNCDLSAAKLANCVLVGTDFSGAKTNLTRAVFLGCDLRATILTNATARLTDFSGALFSDTKGVGAPGAKVDRSSPVINSTIEPAQLRGLCAEGATFAGAELSFCDLTGATLDQSRLDNAALAGAVVQDCTFKGASLIGVIGFESVTGMAESVKAPDFRYAYIQATPAFLWRSAHWRAFRDWINAGSSEDRGQSEERRRLSWVAWKNNYESLGLYAEQSDCFREEQIARGWTWFHRLPERLHMELSHSFVFFVAIVLGLGLCGATYDWLLRSIGPNRAYWTAIAFAVALSGVVSWRLGQTRTTGWSRRVTLLLMDLLYGFGEQPAKALYNALGVVAAFALMYALAVDRGWGSLTPHLTVHGEYLYFSVVTFTTVGYGDVSPSEFCRFLSNCESLLGLVMAALFIHALARRTAGR